MRLLVQELPEKYKGVLAAAAILRGATGIEKVDPKVYESTSAEIKEKIRNRYPAHAEISSNQMIQQYRDFFADKLGLPSEISPTSENYAKKVVANKELPRINPVVDIGNLVAAFTGFPIFIYDADAIGDALFIRPAEAGEEFLAIGEREPRFLEGGELVLASDQNVLCLYPYVDGENVKITTETKNLLVIVGGIPGVFGLSLLWALKVCVKHLSSLTGGTPELVLQEGYDEQ